VLTTGRVEPFGLEHGLFGRRCFDAEAQFRLAVVSLVALAHGELELAFKPLCGMRQRGSPLR